MDMAFKGNLTGVTFNARMDLLKLFHLNMVVPVSLYCRVGVGPVYYRSLKTFYSTGQYWASMGMSDIGLTNDKRVQTSVIPYGLSVHYEFSGNLCAEMEADLYNSTTDYLDAHHGQTSKSNDKFALFTLNVRYTFDWDDWEVPSFGNY